MLGKLFNPDNGLFRSDRNISNEFNLDMIYKIMTIWYAWTLTPLSSDDKKDRDFITASLDFLDTNMGIGSSGAKVYYDCLDRMPLNLIKFTLYRWCMLQIGHIDRYYDAMHEDSPDCKKFIEAINLTKEEIKG
jgi:hypothetical protein